MRAKVFRIVKCIPNARYSRRVFIFTTIFNEILNADELIETKDTILSFECFRM